MILNTVMLTESDNGNTIKNTLLLVEFIGTLKIFTTCHKLLIWVL